MLLYRDLFHLVLMLTTLTLGQADVQHTVRHLRLDVIAINALGEIKYLTE